MSRCHSAICEDAPSQRVAPKCPHFGVCGGCSLQHLSYAAQLRIKQRRFLACLADIARVHPNTVLPPLSGEPWGYRRKARLSVRHVPKKGGALVGFREKRGGFVAEISHCDILEPSVGFRISELRELITHLHARARIPQIEVAVDDRRCALIFRHLDALDEHDEIALRDYAKGTGFQIYLQSGGPETVNALWPPEPGLLSYRLPDFELALDFAPADFVQINASVNRALASGVVAMLEPKEDDRVLDLFCGIGNFALPLARRTPHVLGLEVSETLVKRARHNAKKNSLHHVEFETADLESPGQSAPWLHRAWHKVCLDPPRAGAPNVVATLTPPYPQRIVYISCNPETLARDAQRLIRDHGFQLDCAGIVDIFPHTDHIESISLFVSA